MSSASLVQGKLWQPFRPDQLQVFFNCTLHAPVDLYTSSLEPAQSPAAYAAHHHGIHGVPAQSVQGLTLAMLMPYVLISPARPPAKRSEADGPAPRHAKRCRRQNARPDGRVKGSYTRMPIFLTGNPRPLGRGQGELSKNGKLPYRAAKHCRQAEPPPCGRRASLLCIVCLRAVFCSTKGGVR
jgi:hypothetical protein